MCRYAKDVIAQCFKVTRGNRITVAGLREHPWLAMDKKAGLDRVGYHFFTFTLFCTLIKHGSIRFFTFRYFLLQSQNMVRLMTAGVVHVSLI